MGDTREVSEFHRYDDCDKDKTAHHHTLGPLPFQAAPGNVGESLLSGFTFTGSRGAYDPVMIQKILEALAALGAVDNTTA